MKNDEIMKMMNAQQEATLCRDCMHEMEMKFWNTPYLRMVRSCFDVDERPTLLTRIYALVQNKEVVEFLDEKHGKRMRRACLAMWDQHHEKADKKWLAAIFLLTATEQLWRTARKNVSRDDFDVEEFDVTKLTYQEFALGGYAAELLYDDEYLDAGDLEKETFFDDETLMLILDAAVISRYGIAKYPDE